MKKGRKAPFLHRYSTTGVDTTEIFSVVSKTNVISCILFFDVAVVSDFLTVTDDDDRLISMSAMLTPSIP